MQAAQHETVCSRFGWKPLTALLARGLKPCTPPEYLQVQGAMILGHGLVRDMFTGGSNCDLVALVWSVAGLAHDS